MDRQLTRQQVEDLLTIIGEQYPAIAEILSSYIHQLETDIAWSEHPSSIHTVEDLPFTTFDQDEVA